MHYTKEQFEAMAGEAFTRLPEWVRQKVKNVALLVEDVVGERDAKKMRLRSPMSLLGLYHGTPRTKRYNDAGYSYPDVITLYQLPIEAQADREEKDIRDAVYEVLWHEIGHHFGLDEKEVRKREREQFSRKKKL